MIDPTAQQPQQTPQQASQSPGLLGRQGGAEKQLSVVASTLRTAIWGPMSDMILDKLESAENFNETAGEIAAFLVQQTLTEAGNAGKELDTSILPEVGAEVVNEIYGMAAQAGIYEGDDKKAQEDQGAAMAVAADFLAQNELAGGVDPQKAQHMQTLLNDITNGAYDQGEDDGTTQLGNT